MELYKPRDSKPTVPGTGCRQYIMNFTLRSFGDFSMENCVQKVKQYIHVLTQGLLTLNMEQKQTADDITDTKCRFRKKTLASLQIQLTVNTFIIV